MNANRLRREENNATQLQRTEAAYAGVTQNVISFASVQSSPSIGAKPSPKL